MRIRSTLGSAVFVVAAATGLGSGGCFSPSIGTVECGVGGLCPPGLVCNNTIMECVAPIGIDGGIDSSIDSGPVGDLDGDGVFDDVDNCITTSNAKQYDEDGDQVGDECDNCPGTANSEQLDALEPQPDGVGDACDPRPTLGGDRIAFFDGFNLTADSRWMKLETGAEWMVVDGGLIGSEGDRQAIGVKLNLNSGVIRSKATIRTIKANANQPAVGLVAGLNDNGAIFCGDATSNLSDPPTGKGGIIDVNVGNEEDVNVRAQLPLAIGTTRVHEFAFRENGGDCRIGNVVLSGDDLNPNPNNNRVGFGTIDATANYSYFIVFTSDSP